MKEDLFAGINECAGFHGWAILQHDVKIAIEEGAIRDDESLVGTHVCGHPHHLGRVVVGAADASLRQ